MFSANADSNEYFIFHHSARIIDAVVGTHILLIIVGSSAAVLPPLIAEGFTVNERASAVIVNSSSLYYLNLDKATLLLAPI